MDDSPEEAGLKELPPKVTEYPYVFREIIRVDEQIAAIKELGPLMTQADWRCLRTLMHDKRDNLIPSAEAALSWNTDKGS
jgi:hypothetical protein